MKRNYAFVQFKTVEEAMRAKDATNGGKLDQSEITVEFVARRMGESGGGRGGGGGDRDDRRGRDGGGRRYDDRGEYSLLTIAFNLHLSVWGDLQYGVTMLFPNCWTNQSDF